MPLINWKKKIKSLPMTKGLFNKLVLLALALLAAGIYILIKTHDI